MQLNGSTWKGQKLHVALAAPDYRQRLAAEASAEEDAQHDESSPDVNANSAQPEPITIKLPSGAPLTFVPGSVTGCQKKLFRPVQARPLHEWLSAAPAESDRSSSALYHVNALWDIALERRMRSAPLDPTVFEAAQVR